MNHHESFRPKDNVANRLSKADGWVCDLVAKLRQDGEAETFIEHCVNGLGVSILESIESDARQVVFCVPNAGLPQVTGLIAGRIAALRFGSYYDASNRAKEGLLVEFAVKFDDGEEGRIALPAREVEILLSSPSSQR